MSSYGEYTTAALANWRELPPGERRAWWERLWLAVVSVSARYRLTLRSAWWEDSIQVEALAAFTCWLSSFDTGANADPPAKLQLLWELERLRVVLRAGERAFEPTRDRVEFDRHLARVQRSTEAGDLLGSPVRSARRGLEDELAATVERIGELTWRERLLETDVASTDVGAHGRRDLAELRRAVGELRAREGELRRQLGEDGDA